MLKNSILFLTVLLLFQTFQVFSLENGLARTPPMGWMTWQRYRCLIDCTIYPDECISETLIKNIASLMAKDGYLDAGYEYIVIDDCWLAESRDENNSLQPDAGRFPNGIKALADYVHGLGLKLGIYEDYGTKTCGGYPGSLGYLEKDANTFAEWGIDYLKLDGCYVDTENMEEGYAQMSHYLNATGRPIVFSCSFPAYKELEANYTLAAEMCNLYRNYGDIQDTWSDVVDIANWFATNQDFLTQYAAPGHWNDPDMLIIGNFGLSYEQSKTQMTIWSLLAAPLIMSVDLSSIGAEFKNILLNPYAIKINQDSLGQPGLQIATENNIQVWKKQLESEDVNEASYGLGFVSTRTDGYLFRKVFTLQDYGFTNQTSYILHNVFEPEATDVQVNSVDEIVIRLKPSGAILFYISPISA